MTVVLLAVHAAIWIITLSNLVYLRRRRPVPVKADPFVSILIPARNEAENLSRLLPTILQQSYGRFEIVVFDDESTDRTAEMVQQLSDHRVHLLEGSGPPQGWLGKVAALHSAARHATGDIYMFLDADSELTTEDSLRNIVEAFLSRH